MTFEYKINHISKTENQKNLKIEVTFVLEHRTKILDICDHFFVNILSILSTKSTISQKLKNRKNGKMFFFVGGLHVVNWDRALYI